MGNYLDLDGLTLYDEKIKQFIKTSANNAGQTGDPEIPAQPSTELVSYSANVDIPLLTWYIVTLPTNSSGTISDLNAKVTVNVNVEYLEGKFTLFSVLKVKKHTKDYSIVIKRNESGGPFDIVEGSARDDDRIKGQVYIQRRTDAENGKLIIRITAGSYSYTYKGRKTSFGKKQQLDYLPLTKVTLKSIIIGG